MPWYKVYGSDLVFGDTLEGPGYQRSNTNGPDVDGWRFFGNDTAAHNALGVTRKGRGQDRIVIDDAISRVQSTPIQAAIIAIRDNDPGGPGLLADASEKGVIRNSAL